MFSLINDFKGGEGGFKFAFLVYITRLLRHLLTYFDDFSFIGKGIVVTFKLEDNILLSSG